MHYTDKSKAAGPFKILGGTLGKGEMWIFGAEHSKSGEAEFLFPYQVYKASNVTYEKELKRFKRRRSGKKLSESFFDLLWFTIPLGWLAYAFSQKTEEYEVIHYHLKFVDTNEAIVEVERRIA